MKERCDVCGETNDVECEILLKGDQVDRIYHFCPKHWVQMYRKCLDDFLEGNEYKTNSYIKISSDKMIVDGLNGRKIDMSCDEEGGVDVMKLNPKEIRTLRPYTPDGEDSDYE